MPEVEDIYSEENDKEGSLKRISGDSSSKESKKNVDSPEIVNPVSRIERIVEDQMELMAFKRANKIDPSKFSTEQTDRLLDIVDKNEDNAIKYFLDKNETKRVIKVEEIRARTIGYRSRRDMVYASILSFVIITVIILIFKEQYFAMWIAFITGLFGGAGIKTLVDSNKQKS